MSNLSFIFVLDNLVHSRKLPVPTDERDVGRWTLNKAVQDLKASWPIAERDVGTVRLVRPADWKA